MPGKFEIYKDKAGEFRFRLKAANGQNILSSEGYGKKASCTNGIESVRKNSQNPDRFEKKTTKSGKYSFSLNASNGQVIGVSQTYKSSSGCSNGMSVTVLSLFGQSIHRAVGTGALLGLAVALPGALGFVAAGLADARVPAGNLGYVSLVGFACIAPMTVLTAPLGARIAHAFSERRLKIAFGVFLVFASVRLVYRALG